MPNAGATLNVNRYSVAIPPGTQGPVAISTAVYYQSVEGIVALKFLGNLADLNGDSRLEPCVLGGLCDGRKPSVEPAVVEGAPPVPMAVRNWVVSIDGAAHDATPPKVANYPAPGASNVYQDVVVKVFFSKPVKGVDEHSFTLVDSRGTSVPASVGQIGAGTWGLFPNQVFLKAGESYTARLKAGVCDAFQNCTSRDLAWTFKVAQEQAQGSGDTSVPQGFQLPSMANQAGIAAKTGRKSFIHMAADRKPKFEIQAHK